MEDFICICKTEDNFKANLIKSSLEIEDIFCYIRTNDASGTLPHLRSLQGGIEILVHKEDAEIAKKIVDDFI